MNDYQKYEEACEEIRKVNEHLLEEFEFGLKSAGLSKKTVDNHIFNIDFYVNEYLLYGEAIEAKDGIKDVSEFLGDWFIRKAMWANKSSIKRYIVSLKKFYSFMQEQGFVSSDELADLHQTIKKDTPEWLATLERYDNPSDEDVW